MAVTTTGTPVLIEGDGGTAFSESASVTVPSGTDMGLVVAVGRGFPSVAISSVTFDGNALTLPTGASTESGDLSLAALYYIALGSGGTTANVVITPASEGRISAVAIPVTGLHQTSPWTQVGSSATGADVTLSSVASGALVISCFAERQGGTLTPDDTLIDTADSGAQIATGASYEAGVGANVTMGWGTTGGSGWTPAHVAVEFAPSGGGVTENMTEDAPTSSFSVTGVASVTYQIAGELVTNAFVSDGGIDVSGATAEDMDATLAWGLTPEDGDSLQIYVAGFSDLLLGYEATGTTSSADLTNIAAALEWSATLTNSQTNFIREIEGEAATGAFNSFAGLGFLLNSTLEWGARLEGIPSGNIDLTTGLELLRRDAKIVRNGKDFVADIIRSIVRRY